MQFKNHDELSDVIHHANNALGFLGGEELKAVGKKENTGYEDYLDQAKQAVASLQERFNADNYDIDQEVVFNLVTLDKMLAFVIIASRTAVNREACNSWMLVRGRLHATFINIFDKRLYSP